MFRRLYAARFPIHGMRRSRVYGGSDDRSMAADNTSAFNCRYAVAPGPKRWSVHAYGEAIDVNTVENPYLEGGRVLPPAGTRVRRPLALPARDGGRGRRARARVRLGRLALGRPLDRHARLAALLARPAASRRSAARPRAGRPARASGKSRGQTSASAIVSAPPATTAGTAPSSAAATPDSNAPSSFEAPMNTPSTALTRPRSAFGVASATVVERMFIENMSTKPLTASASAESQNQRESPKTTMLAPKAPTTSEQRATGVVRRAACRASRMPRDQRADGDRAAQHAEAERPGVQDRAARRAAAARPRRRRAPRTGRA